MSGRRSVDSIPGRDPVSQLYRAVKRYVESRGGSILVIGGIETQVWPEEFKYNFRLSVRCMGTKPMLRELDAANPQKIPQRPGKGKNRIALRQSRLAAKQRRPNGN